MALCPTWLAWMARGVGPVSQANSLGMMELTVDWNLDLAECASAPGNWQATAECDGLAQYACAVLQARMLFLLAAPPGRQIRVLWLKVRERGIIIRDLERARCRYQSSALPARKSISKIRNRRLWTQTVDRILSQWNSAIRFQEFPDALPRDTGSWHAIDASIGT